LLREAEKTNVATAMNPIEKMAMAISASMSIDPFLLLNTIRLPLF
jgi:hypothetical protein